MSEYIKQAKDFLTSTNTTFKAEFLEHGLHFEDDKEERDIYEITLKRGGREYIFNFGQSIIKSGFYYTKGVQKTVLARKFLGIKYSALLKVISCSYLNNGKSDVTHLHYPTVPSEYDVLACLTKYNPETFEDFCSEFGYDEDSRSAERVYEAVKDEYHNVAMLWSETEIEDLQEIQ
jgi:hypothetical protein